MIFWERWRLVGGIADDSFAQAEDGELQERGFHALVWKCGGDEKV